MINDHWKKILVNLRKHTVPYFIEIGKKYEKNDTSTTLS